MPPNLEPELPLDPDNNPTHQELLEGIQGNILRGHGRDLTRLILFRFNRGGFGRRKLFAEALRLRLVTTAAQQRADAKQFPLVRDAPFYSFGLSLAGMRACRYERIEMPWVGLNGFGTAMLAQFTELGDVVLPARRRRIQRHPRPDWERAYIKEPHGIWLLANDDPVRLHAMYEEVKQLLRRHKARIIGVEDGRRWKDPAESDTVTRVREPFGFVDGLSDPKFFAGKEHQDQSRWVRIPRSQVIFQDDLGSVHDGGSFLVLRKLEQNVKAFRDFEARLKPSTRGLDPAVQPASPAALLVGRERDGTPLAMAGRDVNDFDFGGDASRCPFHAHIRKANPRVATMNEGPPIEAQFVRRSMVYDPDRRLPKQATADYVEGEHITKRVGLLFLGYMSDLQRQFLTMQQNWFANRDFPVPATELGDPLLRPRAVIGPGGPPALWSWPEQKLPGCPLSEFVRPRGGAYFYVPPISWLKAQTP